MSTTVASRISSLGRAELTLLTRSRAALFTALAVPALLTVAIRGPVDELDLSGTGLTVGTVLVPGSIGFVLLFAVYSNLTAIYVARREELVLKRLRTGEASDVEIMASSALPSATVAVAQSVLLLVGGAVMLGLEAPARADLVVVGVVLGLVLMSLLAAVSAAFTRTTESASLTPMPLMLVSLMGSGLFLPTEVLPERIEQICQLLPMTPVMDLVRGGWTGATSASETLTALVLAGAWIALGVFAVRRWFRWDPRH